MFFLAEAAPSLDPSILQLIGNLGSAAATVTTVVLFLAFLKDIILKQQLLFSELFKQLQDLAKDKGQVLRENTMILTKLESTIDHLADTVTENTTHK